MNGLRINSNGIPKGMLHMSGILLIVAGLLKGILKGILQIRMEVLEILRAFLKSDIDLSSCVFETYKRISTLASRKTYRRRH